MKRTLLFKALLVILCHSLVFDATAQGNKGVMGPRLLVNDPAGVAGYKKFTYSSSSATTPWGRALDSTWYNVPLVRCIGDSLGCTTASTSYGGNWVLIWRGTCQFGEKALYAQQKGAKGVIIINNRPGQDPVGMAGGTSGASVTIPVLMVGNTEGAAMWAALGSSPMHVSLTQWGFGLVNDLALVPNSAAAGPGGAIPLSQISHASAANAKAYRFYTGSFLANTGSANQNGVNVKTSINFTPTGGSATNVHNDTVTIGTLTPTDSIVEAISPRFKNFTPTQTGRYDISYTLASSGSDDNTYDNSASLSVQVTNNIFCKSRIDANENPIVNSGLRIGSAVPISWGPLFYIAKGGHKAQSIRWAISDNDTSQHSLIGQGYSPAFVFKWTDGTGGAADGIMQPGELNLKGAAVRTFTTADSPQKVFFALVGDENGKEKTITLDADSWYWIAIDLPDGVFVGADQESNYYNRSNAAKQSSPSALDFWSPLYTNSASNLASSPADTIRMIPFGVTVANAAIIDSAAYTSVKGAVPSVALELSPFPVSVNETPTVADNQLSVYPNPASEYVNVKINLNQMSSKGQIRVVDALGKSVQIIDKTNLQNEVVKISTKQLAAGTYYIVVIANDKAMFRAVSVTGK